MLAARAAPVSESCPDTFPGSAVPMSQKMRHMRRPKVSILATARYRASKSCQGLEGSTAANTFDHQTTTIAGRAHGSVDITCSAAIGAHVLASAWRALWGDVAGVGRLFGHGSFSLDRVRGTAARTSVNAVTPREPCVGQVALQPALALPGHPALAGCCDLKCGS